MHHHPYLEFVRKWFPDVLFVGGATMLAKYSLAATVAAPAMVRNMPMVFGNAAQHQRFSPAVWAAFVAALGLDLVLRRCAIWR